MTAKRSPTDVDIGVRGGEQSLRNIERAQRQQKWSLAIGVISIICMLILVKVVRSLYIAHTAFYASLVNCVALFIVPVAVICGAFAFYIEAQVTLSKYRSGPSRGARMFKRFTKRLAPSQDQLKAQKRDLQENREYLEVHEADLFETRMLRKELGLKRGPYHRDDRFIGQRLDQIERTMLPSDKSHWLTSISEVDKRIAAINRRL